VGVRVLHVGPVGQQDEAEQQESRQDRPEHGGLLRALAAAGLTGDLGVMPGSPPLGVFYPQRHKMSRDDIRRYLMLSMTFLMPAVAESRRLATWGVMQCRGMTSC
jgi:hypothetical protein